MQFMTVEQIAQKSCPNLTDHEAGEEISPGVVIHRRTILRVGFSVAALTGLGSLGGLGGCASGQAGEDSATAGGPENKSLLRPQLTVNDFLHQIRPQARELIGEPTPNEEAYLTAVATLLARVRPDATWKMFAAGKGFEMDTIAYYPPVVLFQIKMSPNSVIHLHDHRHYNGVLLATAGAARVRNFDIVDDAGARLDVVTGGVPAKNADFLIRQNNDATLSAGVLSTLSRDRDNIHHVEAGPEGCTLVDFFTHFRPEARSYELAWDGKAFDEAKRLYKVAWKNA